MLPGIDDGAPDMATSLEMARIAVSDGILVTACTPHIYPGLYENTADGIAAAVDAFRRELAQADVGLQLTYGADIQLVPELLLGLPNARPQPAFSSCQTIRHATPTAQPNRTRSRPQSSGSWSR
jgi:protein-tyrosine phosphatase